MNPSKLQTNHLPTFSPNTSKLHTSYRSSTALETLEIAENYTHPRKVMDYYQKIEMMSERKNKRQMACSILILFLWNKLERAENSWSKTDFMHKYIHYPLHLDTHCLRILKNLKIISKIIPKKYWYINLLTLVENIVGFWYLNMYLSGILSV